jgi:hypothetical protein
VQRRDRFIQLVAFGHETVAQFAAQSARGGDAQLASVGAGAGTTSTMLPAPGLAEVDGIEIGEKRGTSDLLTQRMRKFCSTVVRMVPRV